MKDEGPSPSKEIEIKTKSSGKKFFTPVVNRIAEENNIDQEELLNIQGTGKGGRVTKVDIQNYIKTRDDNS